MPFILKRLLNILLPFVCIGNIEEMILVNITVWFASKYHVRFDLSNHFCISHLPFFQGEAKCVIAL